MKTILITGYTGFVGSNLTKELQDNILYGVDIVQDNSVSRHIEWATLNDSTDENTIVHLAGKAHDTENNSSEQQYFDINVGLTQKIFKHFLKSSAEKFIFFSSVKAVADTVIGNQLAEDTLPDPKTPYGRSKLEAENFILNELERWKKNETVDGKINERKKVYILRPCMIHGPGNKGNLNLLFILQQKGLPWPLGAFDNKRSFCSIDNLAFIVRQIIENEIEPGIYHVADDETLSTNELIKLMALSQGRNIKIWKIPASVIKMVARSGDLLNLPLNSERLRKLTDSYSVSNQKIKQALGITKMPLTATAGMQKTLMSFKPGTR